MKPKTNIFELAYGLYAQNNGLTTDYTQCRYGHKCELLKELAKIFNGDWVPDLSGNTGANACLVANLATNTVEVMILDAWQVDQSVVFSPEAAEQAKDIIPFDFLKSFWE